ncbi:MAG: hypothetical protein A3D35_02290 [Candidatus Staskawiczbacteria bacterium RIFCSPHIGHO2_02_FULL_34_9]|uniref:Glycosyl transferase n=1 Tax=Candidatus Staskawiczbacteria bacterium RIFCSPHIGHO2_02_FULL_34_9 TaxID=1802206 RepID=A0A1G2I1K0_9BACT|nr:MAG: hypothetical protein A3D35_02290 [Candidatus Staskawiczbacteria bacterium RIFCSPHIGHO2_02_FULL_34_9]
MDRKRIFFLIPVLNGGGAERNIINIIKNLHNPDYDFTVVTGNIGGNLESELGKDVKIINMNRSTILGLFLGLKKVLKQEKPDILVSALPHMNTISMMAKSFSFSKTKMVLTEHTTVSSLSTTARSLLKRLVAKIILPNLMRIYYRAADKIICVSEGVKEDLSLIVGKLAQMQVIYNPVFDESILNLAKEPLGEDQYIFECAYPVIIAVGRLVKAKDYPNLLNAFKKVLAVKKATLLILGEGPEEKYLKNLVTQLKIYNDVVFLGFKKNPYKYMAHSSLFVLSSVREGFGNVIVEAMACNVPVVATNCKSGPGEIINNEVNGLLVEPQNSEALSSAIIKILQNDKFAKSLSDNGLERAKYFSIEKSVKEYENVFNKLMLN